MSGSQAARERSGERAQHCLVWTEAITKGDGTVTLGQSDEHGKKWKLRFDATPAGPATEKERCGLEAYKKLFSRGPGLGTGTGCDLRT